MLQQLPMLARLDAPELTRLAALTTEVAFEAGAEIADASDTPLVRVVLSGSISVREAETASEVGHAGTGDAIGLFETLAARVRWGYRLVSTEAGTLLQLDGDDLFDLIGQRPRLLQHLFTALLDTRSGA